MSTPASTTNGNGVHPPSLTSGNRTKRRGERPPQLVRSLAADQRHLGAVAAVVGSWQLLLAVAVAMAAFGVWPLVSTLRGAATVDVLWFGPDFRLDVTSAALLLGLVGGVAGSLVHTIAIFSSRVGRATFESSFLWWYLLRPFAAGLLALLFVATVHSGMVSITTTPQSVNTFVALVAGGLAGLFTDVVLQKLRALLGATSTERPATSQAIPHAAPPVPPGTTG